MLHIWVSLAAQPIVSAIGTQVPYSYWFIYVSKTIQKDFCMYS